MGLWKRLSVLAAVIKGDARLLWRGLRHPQAPAWLKWGTAGVVLYLLSPVDLIPDVLPVFGVLDDLVVVPLAIGWMLRRLPPWLRADIGADTAAAAGTVPPGRSTR
jgi:uncharacterized membrane protein YkvA (DUF1232 family)